MSRCWCWLAVCWVLLAAWAPGAPEATPAETAPDALQISPSTKATLDPQAGFLLGIEREEREDFANLRRRRLTLFVNAASVDSRGRHTVEILDRNVMLSLATVVVVEDEETSPTPALQAVFRADRRYRLFRVTRDTFRSTNEIVSDSDAVVWDIPLAGTTNSLEASVLGVALEKASLQGLRFIVLDRPSLMRTDYVDGPLSDLAQAGTVDGFLPLPLVVGGTSAELARIFSDVYGIQADLTIQPMSNWRRADGNSWLWKDRWVLSDENQRRLEELRGWQGFQQGWPELASLRRLVGDGLFSSSTIRVAGTRAELLLVPREVPALSVQERLGTVKLDGLEFALEPMADGNGGLLIRVEPDVAVPLVEWSLAIRRASAAKPRQFPADSEGLGYKNASLLQSLGRGLEPTQIRRRWSAAPDYLAFQKSREKVLIYEP